ncbi:BTAD domain-containing putative transcriptional regulator [Nocardia brasiliensis]|uniref:BTAD domain-containing putative transcriptional regulator n=1 Tax=Nocardia brasiliensis TaxID=37326 RepID=UPI00245446BF|nr:BTAD domain-containing putative transcriptional regulator [Nocardia brasiliensis]
MVEQDGEVRMDQVDTGAHPPSVVRLTLLNGVEAHRGDQVLPLGPPQRRAVLSVLAFRRRQWVSADSLLTALYDGVPPASGVGVIQTYVSALRRVLEPDRPPRTPPTVLLSGHGGYQLRIDDEQLDLGVFDKLVAAASRAREAGDLVRAEDRYARALALYAGEPLTGLPGPFAQRQRAALAERRLAVVEDSLDVAVALGRSDEVIDRLRVLTAEHPLRERPRAVLMRALYARGSQSEALDVYRETRNLLVDRLGVEPGPELRRLHEQILSGTGIFEQPRPPGVPRGAIESGSPRTGTAERFGIVSTLWPEPAAPPVSAPVRSAASPTVDSAERAAEPPRSASGTEHAGAATDTARSPVDSAHLTADWARRPLAAPKPSVLVANSSATSTRTPAEPAQPTAAVIAPTVATSPGDTDLPRSSAYPAAGGPHAGAGSEYPAGGSAPSPAGSVDPAAEERHPRGSAGPGMAGAGLAAVSTYPTRGGAQRGRAGIDPAAPVVFERAWELAQIEAWVARAATGSGGLLVISGLPGFGKSQLLDAVVRRSAGVRRIDLTPPWDVAPPLGLIAELAETALEPAESDAHAAEVLCASLLEASGVTAPLVVVVDGADLMDERSARVLAAAAPRLRRMPVLLILALDERAWEPAVLALHGLLEPPAVAILRLSGLSVLAIEGLYEQRTGMRCPPGLAAEIQRATAGIALLAGALIADLLTMRDPGRIPEFLPEGCYSRSISRLLGRYAPRGVVMLRALAVLQEVGPSLEILAAACAEPVSEVRHRCELLAATGILAAVSPPQFQHPLIGNTIRWLCRREDADRFRIAAAEQARSAGYSARQVAAILHDLVGAEYARWTVVLLDAAEECLRQGLIPDAVRQLAAALRITAPAGRDDILVRLGQLELWTNPAAARAHLEEALHSQRERGVTPTALIPLAWTMSTRWQAGAAMTLLGTVLAETEQRDPVAARDIRAASWAVAGLTAASWRGFVAEQRAAGATDQISTAVLTWDDAFGVRYSARETLARFPAEADPARGWATLPQQLVGLLAHLSMWSGDLALAKQLSAQPREHHFGTIDVYRLILHSEVLLRCGEYRPALRVLAPTVGVLDDESIRPPLALVAQYAHALLGLGRLAEARRWLDSVAEQANPETWEWTVVLHVKGMLCAAQGDSRQAVAHYLDCGRRVGAVGISNPAHIPWRSSAALELVGLGEQARAAELAAAEYELAQRWNTSGTLGRALRALAAAAPGGVDADLLSRAVEQLRRYDSPVELVPALLELAAARPEAAVELRREARNLAERMGATRYLALIDTHEPPSAAD